jgi:ribosomal protein L35
MAKKKAKTKKSPSKRFRSAGSGKFEKKAEANRWPKESIAETVKK